MGITFSDYFTDVELSSDYDSNSDSSNDSYNSDSDSSSDSESSNSNDGDKTMEVFISTHKNFFRKMHAPGFIRFKKSPLPRKVLFRYLAQACMTFHVYLETAKNPYRIEKVFECDDETNTISIFPQKEMEAFPDSRRLYISFRFCSPNPVPFSPLSLTSTSILTLCKNLSDPTDIQQLSLPNRLKNLIPKNLKLECPIHYWFFCQLDKMLFLEGPPGIQLLLHIDRLTVHYSIGQWTETCGYCSLDNKFIVVQIPQIFHFNARKLHRLIKGMKRRYYYDCTCRRIELKGRFIIVSNYPPEKVFTHPKDKEWFLNNIFKVKIEGSSFETNSDYTDLQKCKTCNHIVLFNEKVNYYINDTVVHNNCYPFARKINVR